MRLLASRSCLIGYSPIFSTPRGVEHLVFGHLPQSLSTTNFQCVLFRRRPTDTEDTCLVYFWVRRYRGKVLDLLETPHRRVRAVSHHFFSMRKLLTSDSLGGCTRRIVFVQMLLLLMFP